MAEQSLGCVLWFAIDGSDEALPVSGDQLAGWFAELGFDPVFLPRATLTIDAFRSASSNLSARYFVGRREITLGVRQTASNGGQVTRQIERTEVDETGKVHTTRVAQLQFFRPRRVAGGRVKGSETIATMVHRGLEGRDRDEVTGLVDKFKARYEAFCRQTSVPAVRVMLRHMLAQHDGVLLRSAGGGYFLPADREDAVLRLRELTHRIGERIRVHVMPVPNHPEQLELVTEAIQDDVADRCDILIREIEDWLQANPDRGVPATKFRQWRNEARFVMDRMSAYADLYGPLPRAAALIEDVATLLETFRTAEVA